MNSQTLKDNSDLLNYLGKVSRALRENNCIDLAEKVERASLFASGSPSEFLHEARTALERVSAAKPEGIDLHEIQSVIGQIDEAFRKVGGA